MPIRGDDVTTCDSDMFTWGVYGCFLATKENRETLPYREYLKEKCFYLLFTVIYVTFLYYCPLNSLLVLQSTHLGYFCQRLHAFLLQHTARNQPVQIFFE